MIYQNKDTESRKVVLEKRRQLNDVVHYIPSPALVEAVRLALLLGQPLLLTGEPGTGKTQLAHHLAHDLQLGEPFVFTAKTTSIAQDLFYRYDAIGHFQYSQNKANDSLLMELLESQFIVFGALGEAIKSNRRHVVLIDEIDKAPRDFPNDLLNAIEQMTFDVPELKNQSFTTSDENRPIVIITSNTEKNLPDAFLRRVVYHHIEFPEAPMLMTILSKKFQSDENSSLSQIDKMSLDAVIKFFIELRETRTMRLRKKPATAELVYWTFFLKEMGFDFQRLNNIADLLDKPNDPDNQRLMTSYSILAKNQEDLDNLKKWKPNLK